MKKSPKDPTLSQSARDILFYMSGEEPLNPRQIAEAADSSVNTVYFYQSILRVRGYLTFKKAENRYVVTEKAEQAILERWA
jgi:DNA-binding IclR family transcriptional regulator